MDFVKLILSSLLSVAALFIVTKVMGHKQVAQLDFFDYVSGITIGSIGAELATELDAPERPLLALVIYGAVSAVLSLLALKFPKSRRIINGTPSVFFMDGRIYKDNLRQAKIDVSEFMLLCREQGYFDLGEIKIALFEHNGRLSILPKRDFRPLTPRDMKMGRKELPPPIEIIEDGAIIEKNIAAAGYDRARLIRELEALGYKDIKDVFLAIYDFEAGKIQVFKTE